MMLQEGTEMILGYTDLPDPSAARCRSAHEMIERMSDKWSLHVIGTLRKGPCRFNEIRRAIDGVSQRMLTLTLRGLERDGLITRTVFPSVPPRVDYELTKLGFSLLDIVAAVIGWADKNQSAIAEARQRYDKANVTDLAPRPINSRQ
ncbi:winged helix-turn-helix transcriptional regulator [Brucella haematophila]|nr:helix-turn-helix domain-containing protein [Brucella haematophila]